MGYYSQGYGTFTLRQDKIEEEAIRKVKSTYFNISKNPDGTFHISFSEMKMYYAGKSLQVIAEHFDGEFEIAGDAPDDLRKMRFKDGKTYVAEGHAEYGEEEQTDLTSYEWTSYDGNQNGTLKQLFTIGGKHDE